MSKEFQWAPSQPTDDMVRAGMGVGDDNCLYWKHPQQAYVDMLAVAPQPPVLGGEPEARQAFDDWFRKDLGLPDCANTTFIGGAREPWRAWQACSKVYRAHLAPLQAELARMNAMFDELATAVGFSKERCEQAGDSPLDCANQLQAEVERLKGVEALSFVMESDLQKLKSRRDELQILLACRDDDMKSVSVEFDGLAQLLRCALPFVQARCDETDYGDASARTTREGILSVLKRLYPSGLAGSECCLPTAEEKALLAAGDCTPEELWGGSKPTCPKCIGRAGSEKV